MADLGTMGGYYPGGVNGKRVAIWAIDDPRFPIEIPTNGYYAGYALENASPMPNAIVRIHYKQTGANIGSIATDANGYFYLDGLEPGASNYYVVFFDAVGGTNYRAKCFDQVVAIAI